MLPFGMEAECAESPEHTEPMGRVPSSPVEGSGSSRVSSMALLDQAGIPNAEGELCCAIGRACDHCPRTMVVPVPVWHIRWAQGCWWLQVPGEAALGSITAWQAAAQERWH